MKQLQDFYCIGIVFFHIYLSGSYGLFRRMTGVGGRPEVILEGSDNQNGPWKEYHFMYKPGNISYSPPSMWMHQAQFKISKK